MNFYTLISKNSTNADKWLKKVALSTFLIAFVIFSVNYIVDPYNITKYNLLNIKYKFARDDRTKKLNYFKTLPQKDNILIGSSRVYSMNPQVVTDLLGGTTYNFGVGTATLEDHLGIVKYLIKTKKVPKNIIVGVDFYTFNPDVPANKYFLKNKELNFLSFGNYEENYLAKFFSVDAFRASVKTLTKHFSSTKDKPRFDVNGWAGGYENYANRNAQKDLLEVKREMEENFELFYSQGDYEHLDPKRKAYYRELEKICKEHQISLYIFTSPLHPLLLKRLNKHQKTANALKEIVEFLSTFKHFTNFYNDPEFQKNVNHFHGSTHTSTNAGDIILHKVLTIK